MNFEKLTEHYTFLIKEWLANNDYEVSDHIIHIIRTILLNRDGIMTNPGSCIEAFLSNNLYDFFRYADEAIIKNAKVIFFAFNNIDTYYVSSSYKESVIK